MMVRGRIGMGQTEPVNALALYTACGSSKDWAVIYDPVRGKCVEYCVLMPEYNHETQCPPELRPQTRVVYSAQPGTVLDVTDSAPMVEYAYADLPGYSLLEPTMTVTDSPTPVEYAYSDMGQYSSLLDYPVLYQSVTVTDSPTPVEYAYADVSKYSSLPVSVAQPVSGGGAQQARSPLTGQRMPEIVTRPEQQPQREGSGATWLLVAAGVAGLLFAMS